MKKRPTEMLPMILRKAYYFYPVVILQILGNNHLTLVGIGGKCFSSECIFCRQVL